MHQVLNLSVRESISILEFQMQLNCARTHPAAVLSYEASQGQSSLQNIAQV